MPSAAFLDCTSSNLAWPFCAASLAMTVAAAACAFTLSSNPIGSSFPCGVHQHRMRGDPAHPEGAAVANEVAVVDVSGSVLVGVLALVLTLLLLAGVVVVVVVDGVVLFPGVAASACWALSDLLLHRIDVGLVACPGRLPRAPSAQPW